MVIAAIVIEALSAQHVPMEKAVSDQKKLKVQSHILKLLGDQLIGHDRLAVFELVKNSYDADASKVEVELNLLDDQPYIQVKDNGCGMSEQDIERGWLEIGTDYKRNEANLRRSLKYGRLPLGEKGVGRLAVQKLGGTVEVVTRREGEKEFSFTVNWDDLVGSSKYLGDGLSVNVIASTAPEIFRGDATGTLVKIKNLSRPEWSRRDIRELYRLVTSLSSPVRRLDHFDVRLNVPGNEEFLEGLPSVQELLSSAVWMFKFNLDSRGFLSWKYEFTPPKFKALEAREDSSEERLSLVRDGDEFSSGSGSEITIDPEMLAGIGPISGEIYAFHKRPEVLRELGAIKQFKEWMRSQAGVRVYRDGVRVFNYGESGDDWLGLNARRIARPTGKLGADSLIAHVDLDKGLSTGLIEKTNREGFDENAVFAAFHRIVLSIFDKFERIHGPDRRKVDAALKGDAESLPINDALSRLSEIAKSANIEKEVRPIVASIQQQLDGFRDVMVTSGMAGLNLSLAFHEMVHGVDSVARQLEGNVSREDIHKTVTHLRKLLDTFKPLLAREKQRKIGVKNVISRVLGMSSGRFDRHNIVLSDRVSVSDGTPSFDVEGPINVIIGALNNVLDNAIYWSRYQSEITGRRAAIAFVSSWDDSSGGVLGVVDNGPGFELPVDQLGVPFVTNRPDGMGLGLYYAKLVMESIGGGLELTTAEAIRDEYGLSEAYDGAAVMLKFGGRK
ncbi:TPA: ATP-binding protein [Stenotrophomonas maltophilia]|uniref:ATP-binding protein n=1 Tax=Stenotrophomonas maltophilia TaxID=40324 RepID=UPI000C15E89F|nr:ATP-binding protein [Stenotrophomonas maltophilia]MBH1582042.1 ATP-binding protein [Stenotrophomonas maltophilia]